MGTNNQTSLNITQAQPDTADISLVIPAGKLDADQYTADDLDGVTESLFGSGNMAYASLQASQTDALLQANNAIHNAAENFVPDHQAQDTSLDAARSFDGLDAGGVEALGAEGTFTNTTVGSIGASALSSDVGIFSPQRLSIGGAAFSDSTGSVITGSSTSNVNNGSQSNTANNSTTHNDGNMNVVNNTNITEVNEGDDITEIVENIFEGDLVENVINEVTDLTETVTNTVNNVTEAVTNILSQTGVTEIVNQVTNVTNNVTDIVNNLLDDVLGDGKIALNLDSGVLDTLGGNLNLSLEDSLQGSLGISNVTGNLSNIVNGLTGLNVPLISNTGFDIGFNLLGEGFTPDGNDVTIAGLNTPDINLDLLEGIVGDIDINLTLPSLEDVQGLVEGLDDLVGGLGDLDIASLDEALDILGDQGLGGALDVILGENELTQDLNLGIDDILGDGELSDIVGGVGDTLDNLTGGATADLTDALDDIAGEILDPVDDVLDDVVEDISALTDDLTGGLLGGDNDGGADSDVTADIDLAFLDTDIVDQPLDIAFDAVEDITGDLDVDLGLGLDLLGGEGSETDNTAGDTDITLDTGIDLIDESLAGLDIDIPLDPVEDIVGDVDLDLDVGADLLGSLADPLVNDGQGGTGDDTLLGGLVEDVVDGVSETAEAVDEILDDLGGDALPGLDETVEAADALIDEILGDDGLDGAFDPVEELAGDIGLDVDVGNTLGGFLDGGDTPGEEDTSWTESTIDEVGGLFDDLTGGLTGEDVLPDPIGSVAEGLGSVLPDLGGGGSSGGGGKGLFGGLFG